MYDDIEGGAFLLDPGPEWEHGDFVQPAWGAADVPHFHDAPEANLDLQQEHVDEPAADEDQVCFHEHEAHTCAALARVIASVSPF